MKIETILNAMELAAIDSWSEHTPFDPDRRERQRLAFRARILRMFEELEWEVLEKDIVIATQKSFIDMKEWEAR